MHPESDYGRIIGESFRECLGGCAACGLLRKNFPQLSNLSRAERKSWRYMLKEPLINSESFRCAVKMSQIEARIAAKTQWSKHFVGHAEQSLRSWGQLDPKQ